jgi:Transglycosylase SLT domain
MKLAFKPLLISLIAVLATAGCARGKTTPISLDQKFQESELKADINGCYPLAWEKNSAAKKAWSKMVYSVIENEEPQLLNDGQAKDIENYCPNYKNATNNQRLNFWGQLIAAISKPESGWDPTTRAVETTFKYKDSVTNLPVVSEGLLQLSYQDEKSHRLDCGFNFRRDQLLAVTDVRRTILDPYLNLRCGIKILAQQLKKYHAIRLNKNIYWSVIINDSKYITDTTQKLPFCR